MEVPSARSDFHGRTARFSQEMGSDHRGNPSFEYGTPDADQHSHAHPRVSPRAPSREAALDPPVSGNTGHYCHLCVLRVTV